MRRVFAKSHLLLSRVAVAQLFVFGSMATGLYLPGSDIDMVLFGSEGANHMQRLARRLKKHLSLAFMEVITTARVPIIKFTDTETNLQVDICFDQRSGLDSARYIVQTLVSPALPGGVGRSFIPRPNRPLSRTRLQTEA